jgi:hypothetical protein
MAVDKISDFWSKFGSIFITDKVICNYGLPHLAYLSDIQKGMSMLISDNSYRKDFYPICEKGDKVIRYQYFKYNSFRGFILIKVPIIGPEYDMIFKYGPNMLLINDKKIKCDLIRYYDIVKTIHICCTDSNRIVSWKFTIMNFMCVYNHESDNIVYEYEYETPRKNVHISLMPWAPFMPACTCSLELNMMNKPDSLNQIEITMKGMYIREPDRSSLL